MPSENGPEVDGLDRRLRDGERRAGQRRIARAPRGGHTTLASTIGSRHDALETERRQVERAVAPVHDQLGDAAPDRGRLLDPVAEKPFAK
jgi:hypothetical protein